MPVTENGVQINQEPLLISLTDLEGFITYANDEFIAASGFCRDELIGVNRNIVRHSDMPSAVFKDLWQTLEETKPWQGIVKNRTKSGDYYWVETHILPMSRRGKVYGYLSVGCPLNYQQIECAELLYKSLNADKAESKASGLNGEDKAGEKTRSLVGMDSTSFTARLNKTVGSLCRCLRKGLDKVMAMCLVDSMENIQYALLPTELSQYLLKIDRDGGLQAGPVGRELDKVQAGVLVANNKSEIIYISNKLIEMLKQADSEKPNSSELHIAGQVIRFSANS